MAVNLPGATGKVDLIGAGPGDPGLITLRGAECLSQADVILYDQLVHERLLDLAPKNAVRIFAGKRRGALTMRQAEINELLVRHAREGKRVARLKGGDPYLFGRGAEEAAHLHTQRIPFEVVPGVTAAVGAASLAGIPLTLRRVASSVVLTTGHEDPTAAENGVDWQAIARIPGTHVIYMGLARIEWICRRLLDGGLSAETPCAAIQSGSLPAQRVVEAPLGEFAGAVGQAGLEPPVLLVFGEVVRLRESLDWSADRPLSGQTVLVTRPEDALERAARSLEMRGAEVLLAPLITIEPLEDFSAFDQALARLPEFDWLVLTSPRGVDAFIERLKLVGGDLRRLGHLRLAAIGPVTADRLGAFHLRPDLVPDQFQSEELARALRKEVGGRRVLLARADRGRPVLLDELATVAAYIEQVAVYRNRDVSTLPSRVRDQLDAGSIDWVTLTSPAAADRFFGLISGIAAGHVHSRTTQIATISPVTSDAVRRHGFEVTLEGRVATWDGLVQALEDAVRRRDGPQKE